jgi:hypothetical protein
LDDLEPTHGRLSVYNHTSLAYYSYCQSVVRWKRLLLQYVPNAAELIDVLEMLHRVLLHRILRSFECIHSGTDKFSTVLAIGFVRDEIQSLRLCESVDRAEVEHLDTGLYHLILVLCGVLGATDPVTKENSVTELKKQLRLSKSFRISGTFMEASEYWPPDHCKNRRGNHGNNRKEERCLNCVQPPALDVQPTPLQYTQATPTCFPSTMMCCLPSHVLALLDIDMESLTKDIRNPEGWI